MSQKEQEKNDLKSTEELSEEQLDRVVGGILIDITDAGVKPVRRPRSSFGVNDVDLE